MSKEFNPSPEAIKESIEYFVKHQEESNKELALILELIRAEVDRKISPYLAYQKIKSVFPE